MATYYVTYSYGYGLVGSAQDLCTLPLRTVGGIWTASVVVPKQLAQPKRTIAMATYYYYHQRDL